MGPISSNSGAGGAAANGGAANGGAANGGAANSGGLTSQGGQSSPSIWSASNCYEALARGNNGDACKGPFTCSSAARNCCHDQASCASANAALVISEVCDDCACSLDSNCPYTFWCTDGRCRRCVQPPPGSLCAPGLYPFPRNGCTWCVPPNECGGPPGSPMCSQDQVCYAGQTCLPHCDEPACCFGNICDAPGCGKTTDLDCSIVGCPDGSNCFVADPGQVCTCQSGRWLCSAASRNRCG